MDESSAISNPLTAKLMLSIQYNGFPSWPDQT
jgi:hypothetical protein